MLPRPGDQRAFVVIDAGIQNAALVGQQTQHLPNALFIWRFGTHQRGDVKRHLSRQRVRQLFKLWVTLSLMILAEPGCALHQRH